LLQLNKKGKSMIVIIVFLIELAKWVGAALVLAFIVLLVLSAVLKKPVGYFKVFVVVFIVVAASPFLYWKYRFEQFADIKADFCEQQSYAKIYSEPPKDMVALHGKDPSKYFSYASISGINWTEVENYHLNSLVIYDDSSKRAQDSIENQWKKLSLVDRDSNQCELFDRYVKEKNIPVYDFPKNKCVVVEVLDSIDSVNFIDTERTIDVLYANSPFVVSLHRAKVVNQKNDEVYMDIQEVLADFPRYPSHFYAGFVSKSKKCGKADDFREDYVQGPLAQSIIFNPKKVKELKEKGYGL
jgi:hypothetical protein